MRSNILKCSLSHISGQAIVRGDPEAIVNLLEIFLTISEEVAKSKREASKMTRGRSHKGSGGRNRSGRGANGSPTKRGGGGGSAAASGSGKRASPPRSKRAVGNGAPTQANGHGGVPSGGAAASGTAPRRSKGRGSKGGNGGRGGQNTSIVRNDALRAMVEGTGADGAPAWGFDLTGSEPGGVCAPDTFAYDYDSGTSSMQRDAQRLVGAGTPYPGAGDRRDGADDGYFSDPLVPAPMLSEAAVGMLPPPMDDLEYTRMALSAPSSDFVGLVDVEEAGGGAATGSTPEDAVQLGPPNEGGTAASAGEEGGDAEGCLRRAVANVAGPARLRAIRERVARGGRGPGNPATARARARAHATAHTHARAETCANTRAQAQARARARRKGAAATLPHPAAAGPRRQRRPRSHDERVRDIRERRLRENADREERSNAMRRKCLLEVQMRHVHRSVVKASRELDRESRQASRQAGTRAGNTSRGSDTAGGGFGAAHTAGSDGNLYTSRSAPSAMTGMMYAGGSRSSSMIYAGSTGQRGSHPKKQRFDEMWIAAEEVPKTRRRLEKQEDKIARLYTDMRSDYEGMLTACKEASLGHGPVDAAFLNKAAQAQWATARLFNIPMGIPVEGDGPGNADAVIAGMLADAAVERDAAVAAANGAPTVSTSRAERRMKRLRAKANRIASEDRKRDRMQQLEAAYG